MLRYHPRAETISPQGMKYKPSHQWATLPELQWAIEFAFHTKSELFTSPLNCSVEPCIACCTAYLEDYTF